MTPWLSPINCVAFEKILKNSEAMSTTKYECIGYTPPGVVGELNEIFQVSLEHSSSYTMSIQQVSVDTAPELMSRPQDSVVRASRSGALWLRKGLFFF